MRASPLPSGVLLSHVEWIGRKVSGRRLSGADFFQPFRGFYTPKEGSASLNTRCHVLQTLVFPGVVISHATAAALFGIPVPSGADGGVGFLPRHAVRRGADRIIPSVVPGLEPSERRLPILHARLPGSSRLHPGPGVVLHRKIEDTTRNWGGVTVSSPEVVLLELATLFEHDEIVIAIDHLLGPNSWVPGITRELLAENFAARKGTPGLPAALRALADARGGVESPGETRTRLLLVRAGFPEPVPNLVVRDPDTGGTRRIDNAYPQLLIGAEYDGDGHREKDAWRKDQSRTDSLASIGWDLRRLTAPDVKRPARFLNGMRRAFLRAGAAAPPASNWAGREAESRLARPRPKPLDRSDPRHSIGR